MKEIITVFDFDVAHLSKITQGDYLQNFAYVDR